MTAEIALEVFGGPGGLVMEELGEAFSAWRKDTGHLGEDLADTFIFLCGIAEMNGIPLGAEVERKLAINEQREYWRLPNGTSVKVQGAL
jgi:NTP pyrophosphatase (non-canonical NTP hydrolase)